MGKLGVGDGKKWKTVGMSEWNRNEWFSLVGVGGSGIEWEGGGWSANEENGVGER